MTTRTMVPTEKRVRHAAEIFGRYFSYPVEPTIYTFADRLGDGERGLVIRHFRIRCSKPGRALQAAVARGMRVDIKARQEQPCYCTNSR
ncbi:hypothetical protein [Thiocapsa rosea]|uniref:Uncharacterized protein n=1 Tax=Thiocapsa rosea TaxID=69360 RepID=A0A495V5W3_9GAMM|nr:hypothetical protein [Thiocapsa rosea]RKT43198.1 hypothetical protein BDD21_0517 [Thiocapsa rosea]